MSQNKKHISLDEVTLMRVILAILIVLMHSFTCYQGGWAPPKGYIDIPVYKWIARSSFAFTLETFVFISGYLFCFQRITLKKWRGWDFVFNKFKRLILPSIIFSALYFPLFYDYKGLIDLLYNLINGCGHMWFLPMLFWCFIGGWMLEQIKIGDGWKLGILIIFNLFWPISLPLRLGKVATYFFYFYAGYVTYKYRDDKKKRIMPKHILCCWFVFVLMFIILKPVEGTVIIGDQKEISFRFLSLSFHKLCKLLYATMGMVSFYLTAAWYTQRKQVGPFVTRLATCSFGIYLFQQFILKCIYYKTDFPDMVGPYFLPWLGFIIALPLSYILSVFLLRIKIGRFLIG